MASSVRPKQSTGAKLELSSPDLFPYTLCPHS
jgi:hypothetical protein